MGALERIERLPDWPARMTAPVAAAYMGVSQNTFLGRFGAIGVKEGGNTFWARCQLDKIVADQFNLAPNASAPRQPEPSPYDRWKSGQGNG